MFQQIKDRLTITEIVNHYGIKIGKNGKYICPLHSEDTPSFVVYEATDSFYCWGCDKGGDGVKLVSYMFGLSNSESCQKINEDFNLNLKMEKLSQRDLMKLKQAKAIEKRKNEIVKVEKAKPRLVYKKRNNEASSYDYTNEDGEIIYKKVKIIKGNSKNFYYYEKVENKFLSGMGKVEHSIYNLHQLQKENDRVVFIVEGEKDVDLLKSFGFLSVTTGGATSWKSKFTDYFSDRKVVIIPDCDDAGAKYFDEVSSDLKNVANKVELLYLKLKNGGDVSDYYTLHGKEKLFNKLKSLELI